MYEGKQRVFVYGTLRKGEENHGLLARARMLGTTKADDGYTMIDLGDYPAVISNGKNAVFGEVYEISEDMLKGVDELEECPDYYRRMLIATPYGNAWIYVLARLPDEYTCEISSGDWSEYRAWRDAIRNS